MVLIPKRIVSLVPSQTELLYDLGLENEVVGITKFCVHPESWFRLKTRVGGTKTVDLDKVLALKPDLVLANKEENTRIQIEQLAQEFPLWVSDVQNLSDACSMIDTVGQLTGKQAPAKQMVEDIKRRFQQLSILKPSPRVLYLIWQNPWMAAASDTFIDDMLQQMGCINALATQSRYPQLSDAELVAANPDWLMLSSEPYPFKEKHLARLQSLLPDARISLVDGELFSWYGSRLLQTPAYLQQLINEV